ncbi:hypothetical protein [Bacillus wiedmannii]|uniref:hypothetical protein n=1 Tax=Bacillus wiedmannii TaxID=1890302 RepID=UPI000BFD4BBB|nr:hypothetical protein [Bacillus wiedmannii]PHA62882.1 hypothetical protein COE75_16750 [Bacillus wiedmannii]
MDKHIGTIRSKANNMLTKKDGTGHIDYPTIAEVNIKKFLKGKQSYFHSIQLWEIAKELFPSIVEEMNQLSQELEVPISEVDTLYLESFRPKVYDASTCEAIVQWQFEKANGFERLPVTSDEDRIYKIDTRALFKENQTLLQVQVKKKPTFLFEEHEIDYREKLTKDLRRCETKFGRKPEVIFIDFDEFNKNKRHAYWKDEDGTTHRISFPGGLARNKNAESLFSQLFNIMINQKKYQK